MVGLVGLTRALKILMDVFAVGVDSNCTGRGQVMYVLT